MRNRILTLTAAGVLLFGVCATAQDTAATSTSQTDTKAKKAKKTSGTEATPATKSADSDKSAVPASDKMFVKKAAEGGLAEVQFGQLAADKASSNDVKEFGKQMADDHGKANDKLKSIADQKGITLPTDLSAKDKAEKDRLSKLSGQQFDRAYMKMMVSDHMKDVSEFKKESQMGKDNDVKNFASETLPTLQGHLDKAKSVATSTGAMPAKAGVKKTDANKSASTAPPQ